MTLHPPNSNLSLHGHSPSSCSPSPCYPGPWPSNLSSDSYSPNPFPHTTLSLGSLLSLSALDPQAALIHAHSDPRALLRSAPLFSYSQTEHWLATYSVGDIQFPFGDYTGDIDSLHMLSSAPKKSILLLPQCSMQACWAVP